MKVFQQMNKMGLFALIIALSNTVYGKVKNIKEEEPVSYLGDLTPSYTNPFRFLMQASFIYWQADVDGIDFALEQDLQTQSSSTSSGITTVTNINVVDQMKNRNLNFNWNPGFKIGLGAIFGDRDEWDFLLNWTWLHSKAHRLINNGGPSFFPDSTDLSLNPTMTISANYQIPGFSSVFSGSPATFSKTSWRLHYNTLDLEFGRNFFLARNLALRPHIGLRGAWIHQHTNVNYVLGSTETGLFPFDSLVNARGFGNQIGSSQFKGKNNYNGIGLRGGMDMRLNFLNHFCLYGSLAGAILYGEFKVDETFLASATSIFSIPGDTEINSYSSHAMLKDTYHRTRTNFQVLMGVMWHTGFNNDKQHLSISASYEANEWSQQNELRDIQGTLPFTLKASRTSGDLGLHGFTIDVKFDL